MMNIEKIRTDIENKKGETLHFCFHGSRGQIDEFDGRITDTFKGIFLVHSLNEDRVKSYSYSDILIDNLKIDSD